MACAAAVLVSLITLVLLVVVFAVAAAETARRRLEPDPLAGELDTVLDQILDSPVPPAPPRSGRVGLR